MRHHWADEGRARAASHTIHQLTPRVLQNAGSGKVVVEDLPTGRPHSVVAVIGHWPPADSFRWPPDPLGQAQQRPEGQVPHSGDRAGPDRSSAILRTLPTGIQAE